MTKPPDAHFAACMEVLYQVCVHVRLIAYSGERDGLSAADARRIAALTDAVHNIPRLVQTWDRCNIGLLMAFLEGDDEAFPEGPRLDAIYADTLEHYGSGS